MRDEPTPGGTKARNPAQQTDRTAAFSVLSAASRGGVAAILFIGISSSLGLEDFGLFAAVFAIARLLGPLSALGAGWEVQDRLAAGESDSAAALPGLARSVTAAVVLTSLSPLLQFVFVPGASAAAALAIVGGTLLAQSVRGAIVPVLVYRHRPAMVFVADVGRASLQLVIVGPALFALPDLNRVALLFGAANLLWASMWLFWALNRLSRRADDPSTAHLLKGGRQRWRTGLKVSAAMMARNSAQSVDQALLPRLASSSSAGVYALAAQIVSLPILAVGSFGEASQRLLYDAARNPCGQPLVALSQLKRRLSVVAAAFGVLALLGSVAAQRFIPVVTVNVVTTVAVLSVSMSILAASYPYLVGVTALDGHNDRLKIEGIALISNLLLNLALAPRLGAIGAAWATLATESVTLLLARLRWRTVYQERTNR